MIRTIGNERVINMPPSATVSMSMKCAELKEKGLDVITLSGGEPDFDTPALIVEKTCQALQQGRTHYATGTGTKELKEAILKKMKEENGISAKPEQIFVTPGGKFALYMAMQVLLNPGDEVMLITPNWVSYAPMIQAAGGKIVPVEVKEENGYQMTKELLMSHVSEKTKLLLYCSPCNPTGHVVDEKEAGLIADFLEETGIYALADEIYERIAYGKIPYSVGSIERVKNQVVTLMGFSKGYAMTGFRVAWLSVPPQLAKLFKTLYTQTVTCAPPFIMDGAEHAFSCKEEIAMMTASYKERGEKFIAAMNEIEGVTASMPEGAFYAWIRFDIKDMSASQMADYLLEEALVAGVAGIAFNDSEDKHIRFAFAQAEEDLMQAAERIKKALDKL
jgi:aspartate aminotransferase